MRKQKLNKIDVVGSKFTGKMMVTKLEVKNQELMIRVENDKYYYVCKYDKYEEEYKRYQKYLLINLEVVVNYNSWDGLVIKQAHDGIYDMAWNCMTNEEKSYFKNYMRGIGNKYWG